MRRSQIDQLKAELKSAREQVDFLQRCCTEYQRHLDYLDKAWSVLHPIDIAWMGQNPPGDGRDWHNALLYSFRRPLPNGVCLTGLRSQEVIHAT